MISRWPCGWRRMPSPWRTAARLLAASLASSSAVSFCADKRADCATKALAAECEGSAWMAATCPVSCGLCGLGGPVNRTDCADTNVHCAHWAEQGQCATNAAAMQEACPTSCGLCTPEVCVARVEEGAATRGGARTLTRAPPLLQRAALTARRSPHAVHRRSDALPGVGRVWRVRLKPAVCGGDVPQHVRRVPAGVQGPRRALRQLGEPRRVRAELRDDGADVPNVVRLVRGR
eukprot:7299462-Prymnesium_polylepis.1